MKGQLKFMEHRSICKMKKKKEKEDNNKKKKQREKRPATWKPG